MSQIAKSWFIKFFATSVAILGVCFAINISIARLPPHLPFEDIKSNTDLIFSNYTSSKKPNVVIVGSSLANRLRAEFFQKLDIVNLSIPGGSPVSGLAIVAAQNDLPKIVLVETNILSRSADGALIERHKSKRNYNSVRPIRAAVAYLSNNNTLQRFAPKDIQSILLKSPSTFDNKVYIERTLAVWDHKDFKPTMRAEAERLKQISDELELRGTKMLFFSMPYSSELEGSKYATDTIATIRSVFCCNYSKFLEITSPREQLRWDDGAHLDDRSSIIVARSLENAVLIREHSNYAKQHWQDH